MNWRFWEKRHLQEEIPFEPYIASAFSRRSYPLDALSTASVEACIRLISASFEAARIENGPTALNPCFVGDLVRELLKRGEAIAVISVDEGMLTLELGHSYEVKGDTANRNEWKYTVGIGRPSSSITVQRPGSSIVHLTYGVQAENPWLGLSPAQLGDKALTGLASLDRSVRQESAASTGLMQNVTLPAEPDPPTPEISFSAASHFSKLANLQGGLWLEIQARERHIQDGGLGRTARLGPQFTPDVVNMYRELQHGACAVFGVSPELIFGSGDGSAVREAYRRFLLTVLQPLSSRILPELRNKLDAPELSISFDTLRGSDLQGLGRGIRSLIDSGLSKQEAMRLAGVEAE